MPFIMKKLMVRIGLLCLLLVTGVSGYAREMTGLYQAEVPVKSQDRDERIAAYSDAMARVVVKLSGDRSAPQLPSLTSTMGSAQSWVQQYRYQPLDNPGLKDQGYVRLLTVQFDERAVNQALVAAGVPLWGKTRPDLLVWLAVDDGSSRMLVASNSESEFDKLINANARRRGLPVLLPLMDIEDQTHLSFGDIWGNFRQPIMDASQRYGANAVLVGRINTVATGGWQGRWSLYQGDDMQHWNGDGADLESVVAAGIDGVADRFAQRYAQLLTAGAANQEMVTVTGISNLAAYARAMQYLQSLDLITKVQVAKVQGDEVLFALNVRGDIKGIDRVIALGGTLRRAAAAEGNQALVYQLLP